MGRSGRADTLAGEAIMERADPQVAVYTGTFDPVHLGHLDIIERGSRIFRRLIVGVGINPEKTPFFSIEERIEMLQIVCQRFPNVEVRSFHGLAVCFVRSVGAGVMLRGLRTVSDMEYEFSMSLTNQTLDPEIETVFLMAKVEYSHLSSSLIRQIAAFGGDLSRFLPAELIPVMQKRVRQHLQLPNPGIFPNRPD
ncbi:MAG: pantetheine-phosphate adenylyltransferase [Gemmatales bacterium]|nr:pantetheine-phosphate adenylyltransferase [Gemmatales bacterium]MDW7994991.1 pantetheine-phosphate adenylyltransferase [Gemmatales bacterium]